jgi:6-phosphofructokinase 1
MHSIATSGIKKIAVLTSGGDAPGMNAAVRAVVRRGSNLGLEVYGVRDGYKGLIFGNLSAYSANDVGNIIQRGGTILGTSRCPEMHTEPGRAQAAAMLRQHGIHGLVVVGGDGSFRGAELLAREHQILVVGLPGTIDNDIAGTDSTIGFDTAVNTAMDAIDRLRDTAESHQRLFFVEVMGRTTGHIAAHVAIAGGAEHVLVPETETHPDELAEALRHGMEAGRRSTIVIVAEGDEAGGAVAIAKSIQDRTGYDSRVAILGHIQRGGRPTACDRVLATRLGAHAVEALASGQSGFALGDQGGRIVATPFNQIRGAHRGLDLDLIELARDVAG